VEALHDQDDAAISPVIQAAAKGMIVPLIHCLALGLRERLFRLQWAIDDDGIRPAAGQHTADRGA
jgi:hypothetical protein